MKSSVVFDRPSVILCFLATFLFCVNPAYAERPAQGNGKAIKDKIQEVLNKTDTLGSNLEALCDTACQGTPAGDKFKEKVQRLRQAHTRVKSAHFRTQDGDFQELVRRRPKKKAEGCDPQVQVCDANQVSATVAGSDLEFDEERGKDMMEDLGEVGTEVDELNDILAGNVPPPPPIPDVNLENAEYFFPASLRASPGLSYGAFIASQVAQKASAIADHGCDQVAVGLGFGGNASAACIVVEGVFQVLDYVYQVMKYINDEGTSAEVTGTYKRTKNIFDQLVITDSKTDGTKEVVDAMGKKLLQLEENQKIIIQLLSTPQGQRPGFPNTR